MDNQQPWDKTQKHQNKRVSGPWVETFLSCAFSKVKNKCGLVPNSAFIVMGRACKVRAKEIHIFVTQDYEWIVLILSKGISRLPDKHINKISINKIDTRVLNRLLTISVAVLHKHTIFCQSWNSFGYSSSSTWQISKCLFLSTLFTRVGGALLENMSHSSIHQSQFRNIWIEMWWQLLGSLLMTLSGHCHPNLIKPHQHSLNEAD